MAPVTSVKMEWPTLQASMLSLRNSLLPKKEEVTEEKANVAKSEMKKEEQSPVIRFLPSIIFNKCKCFFD